MDPKEKIACARVVVAVILADGAITDEERLFLEKVFEELGLRPEERREAYAGLSVGDGPGDALLSLKSDASRRKALSLAMEAMTADGEASQVERKIVEELAEALGLSQEPEEVTRLYRRQ